MGVEIQRDNSATIRPITSESYSITGGSGGFDSRRLHQKHFKIKGLD